jgi:hypothetical protein
MRPCLRVLALLATICAGGAARAGAPLHAGLPTGAPTYRSWAMTAIDALQRHGDPGSLATAAALGMIGGPNPDALGLVVRASSLAPEDAPIGWIRLRLCAATPTCDVRDAATTMRWLDPDNAAAWLPTLSAAQRDKDAMEVDRVLADMAQGGHFDFYWNRIVVLMFESLKQVAKSLPGGRNDSDSARLMQITRVASAEMIPPLRALMDACRETSPATALADSGRRESCLKIAKTLQQGDTITAELLGISLEKRLIPADSRELRALVERRRVLEWRTAQLAKFDTPLLPWIGNAHARLRLAHMRSLRREQDVALAILRGEGGAVDPPAAVVRVP